MITKMLTSIFFHFLPVIWLTAWPLNAKPISSSHTDSNEAAIDSLSKIPTTSPYFYFAQQRLAELYLSQNTVRSRKKAKEYIEKAVWNQPQNMEFQLTYIKVLFEQGFFRTANASCDRLLSIPLSPGQPYNIQYAETYYYKGLIAERFAFKYKDMISVIDDDNFISLAHYGEEDLKSAAYCYERALEFESTHRDALFHLGLLYYEIRSFDKMAKLFNKIIDLNKRDKDAYAFAALAYYHMAQYEKSQEYYQTAMNFMSEEELVEFNYIGYIVAPEDQKQYQNGASAPSKAAGFQESFWNKKDPLYLTTYNERLLEHYNRMTYVNLRFSVPRMQIAGWKTDRGMIYIRYGKPVICYKTQPDEKALGGTETWVYPQFSFTFSDEYASGQFLMDQKSFLESRSAYNTNEDSYSLPIEKTFEMQSRLYQFRGDGGSTRAKAYFKTYVKGMEPEYDTLTMDVEAECGLFFLDAQANIIHESRKRLKIGRQDTTDRSFVSFVDLGGLPTQTEASRYSFEIMTLGDHRSAVSRDSIHIRNFTGDGLMMSDVIIASSITEHPDIKIIPNFTNTFSKRDNLYLYFELYNLLLNNESRGRYKISTRIQPHGGKGIFSAIGSLMSGKKEGQIGSSFDVTSYSRDDRYYFGLNLTDIPEGYYDLYLQITDEIAHASIERVLPITITP